MSPLADRVALITGATGALGAAVSAAFSLAGARVAASGRAAPEPPAVADRWLGIAADVATEAGASEVVAATIARFGRLDVLAHLVGGWSGGTDVDVTGTAQWDQTMRTNLTTAFFVCRAVIPQMKAQRFGRIITVGSRTAVRPARGQAAYSAAKAAVMALTQSLAEELRDHGITANCLLPSVIDTPANRRAMPQADPAKWVQPEHLAALMVTLASGAGTAVSGAVIPVYGQV